MVAASTHTDCRRLVMADALKRAATGDRAALRDAVAASDVDISTGRITFNDLGEVSGDQKFVFTVDSNLHIRGCDQRIRI